MNVLELFAGGGLGILGSQVLGHRCIAAVEIDPAARRVLMQRQNDGALPPFPIWDDVLTFNANQCPGYEHFAGLVDVLAGGPPCTDTSSAKQGAEGIDGPESGLWREMARVARDLRPCHLFMEVSSTITARGLELITGALATIGYVGSHDMVGAHHLGAPHYRNRIWILARHVSDRACPRCDAWQRAAGEWQDQIRQKPDAHRLLRWPIEPAVDRVVYGVAGRVDRIRILGKSQVPAVRALAFYLLHRELGEQNVSKIRR